MPLEYDDFLAVVNRTSSVGSDDNARPESQEYEKFISMATGPSFADTRVDRYATEKPEGFGSAFVRGGKESFQQLPELGWGLAAGASAGAESVFGEGGLSTGIKNFAVKKYVDWQRAIAKDSRVTDDLDFSYERAKEGDLGALVSWGMHGLGYVGGQAVQMLSGAGIGKVAGQAALKSALPSFIGGMVEKEAGKIASGILAKTGAEATAAELAAVAGSDEVIKQATRVVAGKLGEHTAMAGMAFGMEGGEIGGGLAEKSVGENRALTGEEVFRGFAGTLMAGTVEYAENMLGLKAMKGKLPMFGAAERMGGASGRLTRGVLGAAEVAPIEAGQEYVQTGIEQWAKGDDLGTEQAATERFNAAGLGALGGSMGFVGGAIKGPSVPTILPEMRQDETIAEKVDTAAQQVSAATQPGSASAFDRAGDLLARIKTADEAGLVEIENAANDVDLSEYADAINADVAERRKMLYDLSRRQFTPTGRPSTAEESARVLEREFPASTTVAPWMGQQYQSNDDRARTMEALSGGSMSKEIDAARYMYGLPPFTQMPPGTGLNEGISGDRERYGLPPFQEPAQEAGPKMRDDGLAAVFGESRGRLETAIPRRAVDDKGKSAKNSDESVLRANPVYGHMAEAKKRGGINISSLRADWDKDTISAIIKRYPGMLSKNGRLDADEFAGEMGYSSADEMVRLFADAPTLKSARKRESDENDMLLAKYEQDAELERDRVDAAMEWMGRVKRVNRPVFMRQDEFESLRFLARSEPDKVDMRLLRMSSNQRQTIEADLAEGRYRQEIMSDYLNEQSRDDEIKRGAFGRAYTEVKPGEMQSETAGTTEEETAEEKGSEKGAGEEAPGIVGLPAEGSKKEPWQMTREEYVDGHIRSPGMHMEAVRQAVMRGEDVPSAVLADYPDLANRDKTTDASAASAPSEVTPSDLPGAGTETASPEKAAPAFEIMVREASRWKGAAMKAAEAAGSDKRAQLSVSRQTTKGDLDAYLVRKFGISESEARDVSNALTRDNIPADTSASIDDFSAEPWASPASSEKITWTPEQQVKISSDSINGLRPVDVYRVLKATPAEHRDAMLRAIVKVHPSNQRMQDEIRSALKDLAAEGRQPPAKAPAGAGGSSLNDRPKTSTYGESNTLVSKSRADELRARLRQKLNGSQLNSGIDPEMLALGTELAVYHIEAGARSFVQFASAMVTDLGERARPFLKSWYMGAKNWPGIDKRGMDSENTVEDTDVATITGEVTNEPDQPASESVERDGEQREPEEPMGSTPVPPGPRPVGRGRKPGVQGSSEKDGPPDSIGLPGYEASVAGTQGDISPFAGKPASGTSSSGSELDSGSSDPGLDGPPIEPESTKGVDQAATGRLDHSVKRGRQRAAERIDVIAGDRDNIAATLPFLLPAQHNDVLFAEQRLSQPTGYGVMFTNGTGTGKTFSGLGIVKRMQRQGRGNILIVVPSDKIASDWVSSGKELLLDIVPLENTRDHGNGIVITTYANMGANDALARRDWDMVVHDEAHYLSQDKDGTVTNSLRVLRAITMHPDGAYQRLNMLHRETIDRINSLSRRIDQNIKIMNLDDTTDREGQELVKENEILEAERQPLIAFIGERRREINAQIEAAQGANRPRVVMLSATPFAYEPSIQLAEGYLFTFDDVSGGGYNSAASGYEKFMMEHFGWRKRYGKLQKPDKNVNRGLMQRTFNTWLKRQGSLSGRMVDLPHDYDRKFALTPSAIGRRIDQALEWLSEQSQNYRESHESDKDNPYYSMIGAIESQFDHLTRRYLLEAIKAREAVPIIKEHLKMGRKVVVFHDFKKGGGFNPFTLEESDGPLQPLETEKSRADWNQAVRLFNDTFADLVSAEEFSAGSPIATLSEAFPDALIFNGSVSKQDRREAARLFQDDNSGRNLIVGQSAAMREGISLHDTSGKHPRVLINLGLPTQPTTSIQQEGRIYRVGQASPAMFRYLNTGTNWERWAFATTVAQRASAAENLAMGESARALLDSFVQGYQESDSYPPGHEGEGSGGKARDAAANNALSDWDRAIALYFGQRKRTSRDKSEEGTDYFPTPEPLGQKMVEWAGLLDGERSLEPSAGHGAIARWLPENSDRTAVEPSAELASRLRMALSGESARVLQQRFEDLDVGANKYDAIVMNPPFGTAGKTAIEHLGKAAKHLRPGGRLVALIPDGPAMNKRFDSWLYEEDGRGRSVNPLSLTANILLPSATFERAGTKISARIVILDKPSVDGQTMPAQVSRDYRDADSVNDFFDRLKDATVPKRAPKHGHIAAGENKNEKKEGQKYITDAPEVTYTTRKGKVLRGVIAKDLTESQAKAIDPYTWKKDGGYFIRMDHVQRPSGAPMLSRATPTGNTVSAVTSDLRDKLKFGLNRLLHSGRVEIVQSEEELPENIARFMKMVAWHGSRERFDRFSNNKEKITGENAYRTLHFALGSQKAASEYLHSLGIRGIKYLDWSSRGKGEGSHNYVIFDDADISIEAVYSKNGGIAGAYDPKTGKTYLVADHIKVGETMSVLAHELGVHARNLGFKNDAEYKAILRTLERRQGEKGTTGEAIRAAIAVVPEDTRPEHYWDEVAAYLIQQNYNDDIGIVRRLIALVKKWLVKAGLSANLFSEKDLVAFAHGAIREAVEQAPRGGNTGQFSPFDNDIRYSAARNQTNKQIEQAGFTKNEQGQRLADAASKAAGVSVTAWNLPDSATGKRAGDHARSPGEVAAKVARLFKKRVVFATIGNSGIVSGMVVRNNPILRNTVFIDIQAENPAQVVLGHEMTHQMRVEHPEIYGELESSIMAIADKKYFNKYRKELLGTGKYAESDIAEEYVADIVGLNFDNKIFWEKLAEKTRSKNVFEKILSWLNGILRRVKTADNLENMVSDVEAAIEHVSSAMAKYYDKRMSGDIAEKMAAEIDGGRGSGGRLSRSQVIAVAEKVIGKQEARALIDAGVLRIGRNPGEFPEIAAAMRGNFGKFMVDNTGSRLATADRSGRTGAVVGATLSSRGVTYIFTDNVKDIAGFAEGNLLHEGIHLTFRQLLGDSGYQQIMHRIAAMMASAKRGEALNGFFARAIAKAKQGTYRGEDSLNEEVAAYAVAEYMREKAGGERTLPMQIRLWVKDLLGRIRAAILRYSGPGKLKTWAADTIDEATLAHLAIAGLRGRARSLGRGPNPTGLRGGNTGQFPGLDNDIRFAVERAAEAIYSKLERVARLKFVGLKAQSVENFLLKQGVKKAEIEAVGLREWLAGMKPADKVTRDELLSFVQANTVRTEDVVLGEGGDYLLDQNGNRQDDGVGGFITRPNRASFRDYTLPGSEEGSYREMFVTAPKAEELIQRRTLEKLGTDNPTDEQMDGLPDSAFGMWQDGHTEYSDIKNPIVRIRFNTRTDEQGRRGMFIEEMQGPSEANQQKMPDYLRENIYQIGVKRALAMAKEQGFDFVAWTPGDAQAERYNLSKQVKEIRWVEIVSKEESKDGKPRYSIGYTTLQGQSNGRGTIYLAEELGDVIGKELARKIINSSESSGKFEGDDLRLYGGDGLKKLYDRDIPAMFKAYGKAGVSSTMAVTDDDGKEYAAPVVDISEDTPGEYPLFSIERQEFFSDGTSQSQIAAVFTKPWFGKPGTINLDIGGGKYDKGTEYLKEEKGIRNILYDPFNRERGVNKEAIGELLGGLRADTVTVNSVLNVIREPSVRANVIHQAANALKPEGTAYFTIHEGSATKTGKKPGDGVGIKTSRGWQNYKKTSDYLEDVREYFGSVSTKDNIIIAQKPRGTESKAVWLTNKHDDEEILFAIDSDEEAIIDAARIMGRIEGKRKAKAQAKQQPPASAKLPAGSISVKERSKPDSGFIERLLSTPEYYFKKFPAAWRVLQAALKRRDIKFEKEKEILGNFVKNMQELRKKDPRAYLEANEYLVDTDQTSIGFSVREDGDEWIVTNGLTKKEVGRHDTEAKAIAAMLDAEGEFLQDNGYSRAAIGAIRQAREVTNKGFDTMAADMRAIIAEAKANGLPDPFVGDGKLNEAGRYGVYAVGRNRPIALFASQAEAEQALDRAAQMISYIVVGSRRGDHPFMTELKAKEWARKHGGTVKSKKTFGNLFVRQRSNSEMRPLTVKQALAQMGDLRGTYFPRIRENGEYILIAKKKGFNPIRKHYDIPAVGDATKGSGVLNMATPMGREAARLKAEGYTVEIRRDEFPSEDIFAATNLVTALDAVLQQAMRKVDPNEKADLQQAQTINAVLTLQVADLFKARGYLSSRMKRLAGDDVWEGYETDMAKALARYATGIAAGTAKRDTARAMVLAFTGKDYTWQEYKEEVDDPDYAEYQAIVEERRIDPGKQKGLYGDVRKFIIDVLRNDDRTDRVIGTMKGLAALKFLAFRVSSAAINATNMAQGVPATLAGHLNIPVHRAMGYVTGAAVDYGKFRTGKGNLTAEERDVFAEIVRRGWDEAQFNHDTAKELRGKGGEVWHKVMTAGMFMFGAVEKANRAMTIYAAYKAAKEKHPGSDFNVLLEQAHEVSNKAHGVYGKETLPAWARGESARFLRLPYTFAKFTHNYLLNMWDLGVTRKQYAAAAHLLIAPGLLAGAGATLATPLLVMMAGAIGLGGDDPEEEFYAWAENTFGSDRFFRHGMAGLVGVNIKGSLQVHSPMPTSVASLAGAPGAIFTDIWKGTQHFAKGEVLKGLEAYLPTAVGSLFKALREGSEGVTTGNYGTVFYGNDPLRADAWDTALRVISFNPAHVSGIREKQWRERQVAADYQEEKREIYAAIKRHVADGKGISEGDLKAIWKFNERVIGTGRPDIRPITSESIKLMLKMNARPSKLERSRKAAAVQ